MFNWFKKRKKVENMKDELAFRLTCREAFANHVAWFAKFHQCPIDLDNSIEAIQDLIQTEIAVAEGSRDIEDETRVKIYAIGVKMMTETELMVIMQRAKEILDEHDRIDNL